MQIWVALPDKEIKALSMLFVEFKELFVWKSSNMSGISKKVIVHELNIDMNMRTIAQKWRHMEEEKTVAFC